MTTAAERNDAAPLLELRGVSKRFIEPVALGSRIAGLGGTGARERVVQAVDRVDLDIAAGEVVGLMGESRSGKSTLGRLAAGLLPLSAGARFWRGIATDAGDDDAARAGRLRMQMLFQDPDAALNPRRRVVDIVGEAPVAHGIIGPRQQIEYVGLQLNRVGLDPTLMWRFPHEFSGGQRVRIGIARALAVKPELLVCDEPVAALDVSVQAQVLNLLLDLRAALDLAYLFISREPGVLRQVSDRVVVMYLGRVVEWGPAPEVFASPNHPYTQALLAATGKVGAKGPAAIPIRGEIPSPLAPPPGCQFHPRCPYAMPRCSGAPPTLAAIAPGRRSACYLNDSTD